MLLSQLNRTILVLIVTCTSFVIFQECNGSDLGRVQEITPESLPQPNLDHLNWEKSFHVESPLITQTESKPVFHLGIQHLESPAGTTAYILDRSQFEIFYSATELNRFLSLPGVGLGLRYGILSSLTLETQAYENTLALWSVRWNALQMNQCTYTVKVSYGFHISTPSPGNETHSPAILELIGSQVVREVDRIHFSLGTGLNNQSVSYGSYTYSSSGGIEAQSTSRNTNDNRTSRLSLGYEKGLSNHQNITIWGSIIRRSEDLSYLSDYSHQRTDRTLLAGLIGLGYQYGSGRWGVLIGASGGVGQEKISNSYYGGTSPWFYSSDDKVFVGSITGGLSYRL